MKNGIDNKESVISTTYIDDLILRLDKTETEIGSVQSEIDDVLNSLDNLDHRTKKVEARLGLG